MSDQLTTVVEMLNTYFRAFYASDAGDMAGIFHPQSQLVAANDGNSQIIAVSDWLAILDNREPVPASVEHRGDIKSIVLSSRESAVAVVEVRNAERMFVDTLSIARYQERWVVVAKTYYSVAL